MVFPLAAIVATFFVVIPCATLVSRALLSLKRRCVRTWEDYGSETTFALLVAPTLVPVLWLTSAALHQSEPSRVADSCLLEHSMSATCLDAMLLVGVMIAGMLAWISIRARRERPSVPVNPIPNNDLLARRVASICDRDARLRRLTVRVARRAPAPVFTMGWIRPTTVVDACFVRDADDAMIHAALLHEFAHAMGYDNLRGFIARLCLSMNPLGSWLAPDLARWRQAREARCDSEAVRFGGETLALAEGIVQAAKFRCRDLGSHAIARLCGHDRAALRLRLALLLDGPPRARRRSGGHVGLLVATLLALVLPHFESVGVLERFHMAVEQLLHTLG